MRAENVSSIRVAEKVGMRLVERVEYPQGDVVWRRAIRGPPLRHEQGPERSGPGSVARLELVAGVVVVDDAADVAAPADRQTRGT